MILRLFEGLLSDCAEVDVDLLASDDVDLAASAEAEDAGRTFLVCCHDGRPMKRPTPRFGLPPAARRSLSLDDAVVAGLRLRTSVDSAPEAERLPLAASGVRGDLAADDRIAD